MTGELGKRPSKDAEKQSEITDVRKAFKTAEAKMPDIVGLFSTLTQKLTHFHIKAINQRAFRYNQTT
jgi:hypothetical protein